MHQAQASQGSSSSAGSHIRPSEHLGGSADGHQMSSGEVRGQAHFQGPWGVVSCLDENSNGLNHGLPICKKKNCPNPQKETKKSEAAKAYTCPISFKHTLELPPTQNASHHQDYSIFSKEYGESL